MKQFKKSGLAIGFIVFLCTVLCSCESLPKINEQDPAMDIGGYGNGGVIIGNGFASIQVDSVSTIVNFNLFEIASQSSEFVEITDLESNLNTYSLLNSGVALAIDTQGKFDIADLMAYAQKHYPNLPWVQKGDFLEAETSSSNQKIKDQLVVSCSGQIIEVKTKVSGSASIEVQESLQATQENIQGYSSGGSSAGSSQTEDYHDDTPKNGWIQP